MQESLFQYSSRPKGFSCKFYEIFKNLVFIEHVWWLLLHFEIFVLNMKILFLKYYLKYII